MKHILLSSLFAVFAMVATAEVKVDIIPGSVDLELEYPETAIEMAGESGAIWSFIAKDEGDGPQIKASKGGIINKTTAGTIKKIEVTWGKKTNETLEVYVSHEPFADAKAIEGEPIGTIEFEKNETVALEIEGNWEYVGIKATAVVDDGKGGFGKAAKFQSIAVTWEVAETAINNIDAQAEAGVVYNLLGQRVYNPGKGLYIINGKKTIIR